jgi:protein-tyrosine phosphatase
VALGRVYWVTPIGRGRLGLMPHPRGDRCLAGEIQGLRAEGVDRLISLLTPSEAWRLGLAEERGACERAGIAFDSYPIEDRDVPAQLEPTISFLRETIANLHRGEGVAIHCRVGVGRSGLMTASLLVLTGVPAEEAIARVAEARRHPIPDTAAQREWIVELSQAWRERHTF